MVMAAVTLLGVLATTTLCRAVDEMVDSQLNAAADGFSASVTKFRTTPQPPTGQLPEPWTMKPLTHLVGQAPGNIVALIQDGRVVDAALFGDGDAGLAPVEASQYIDSHQWTGGGPQNVELPGVGAYVMEARPGDRDGELLVTGVSTRSADRAVTQMNIIVYSLTALTVLATGLGTLAIVRYALKPLGRVTSTAAEVATLPLDRDNYAINLRVPEDVTDPRTEVGLVGHTLNRLLVHVGGALAEVAASDRRMRQFITDASHELRTPLAAILGHAELTRQDSTVLPENTEYALARIESESKRMNALVSELLLLARLDEGDDLLTTDFDLAQTVRDAVNDTAVTAPTHDWVLHVTDEPLWCRGDDAKMHQALANLLSNARIHTPAGTTVTTAVRAHSGHNGLPAVEITITDDGPGIAPELLPHLFERFVRADASRSRQAGGTGLGLAIVASIIEAHGGTISAESDPHRTTFRISVPTAATATSKEGAESLATAT
ncbi:MAG TPA: HAMP domain-containing sensor histidine kinase [Mycobacterium sp.]|nr:HAMP domain-containing sensor histidine kinase [Mycobacterium sp.]